MCCVPAPPPSLLLQDRSIAIEASVVRIMKTRKVFSHQELVTEVLKQLHLFRPNPKVGGEPAQYSSCGVCLFAKVLSHTVGRSSRGALST